MSAREAGGEDPPRGEKDPEDYYLRRIRSEAYRRERPAKARVIARICGRELRRSDPIADLGSGTGLVKKELEVILGKPIVGFEIDMSFLEETERVAVADVLRLPVADGSLGFAVANHLYEHVRSQAALFGEIFRALAPGGEAYVAAGNRLALVEPHYRLPFLSWLPGPLADLYVRIAGRGEAYRGICFRTRPALIAAIREAGFEVEDRTERALDELLGEAWGPGWDRLWKAVRRLPAGLRDLLLRWLSPQWFLLLRKPGGGGGGVGEEG